MLTGYKLLEGVIYDSRFGLQWISNRVFYFTSAAFYQQARIVFAIGLCFSIAQFYNRSVLEVSVMSVISASSVLALLVFLIWFSGVVGKFVLNGGHNPLRHSFVYVRLASLLMFTCVTLAVVFSGKYIALITAGSYPLGLFLLACNFAPPRERTQIA